MTRPDGYSAADTAGAREQLVQDVRAVIADTDRLLQALAQGGEQQAAELRAKMTQNLRTATARLDTLENDVAERAGAAARQARGYAREHPWQALGVAAGIGLLAGLALGRR
jgi:ElaB/YqjD/DUF883 family membrane-anchored ribosome-binding protein